jgi:hypothetical protein
MSLGLEHFSGYHSTLMTNPAQAVPRPFLGYYPGLYKQSDLDLKVSHLSLHGSIASEKHIEPPRETEVLAVPDSYDSRNPVALDAFGECTVSELGSVVLARSGDKGGNINIGFIPRPAKGTASGECDDVHWDWLRSFLTLDKMKELIADDWRDEYSLERVEFPGIKAVHFVVYGILGRGVTSSPVLDNLGKGFADYIRGRHVPIPKSLLQKSGFVNVDEKL